LKPVQALTDDLVKTLKKEKENATVSKFS